MNKHKGKVVFFDIDGTLLNEKMKLPRSTKESIFKLQDSGIIVAIATGRAAFMFEELREELKIDSYVSSNGSYVVAEGEVVSKTVLQTNELIELERAAGESKHAMVFMDHEGVVANREDNRYISQCLGELGLSYPPVKLNDYHNRDIYQALLFCEKHEEDYLSGHKYFDYIRWHKYALDILPGGGSKALGVDLLLDHYSATPNDAYAFGDGFNDLEMLKFVGTGIAMENGRDEVKAIADYVTNHVDQDGIYHGLRHVGLLD